MPLLINKKFINNKNKYLKYLQSANIETRPIISGNFTNQKCIDLHKIKYQKKKLINSQEIEKRGFFIVNLENSEGKFFWDTLYV